MSVTVSKQAPADVAWQHSTMNWAKILTLVLDLHKHPSVPIPDAASPTDAAECPALKKVVSRPYESEQLDEKTCPVAGSVTQVLPPDHPSMAQMAEHPEKQCPVTKATMAHHKVCFIRAFHHVGKNMQVNSQSCGQSATFPWRREEKHLLIQSQNTG